ncbi:DUF302 domain-containing protein [Mesorhizobium sp. 2RAF21]|uniref:DUF302 domain-containing protein n=1 Tax=Mesorhizobium sp. 2RAF21 TaxID=3232995 RepID=UPI003F952814
MMFRIFAVAATAMIIAMAVGRIARAESPDLIVKESAVDFSTTVQRLQAEIEKRGAKIVATVDHASGAKANGLEMRPTTVIIFGNPMLGTPLMESLQTAGLDLPLRVLIWEDAGNNVRIGYWPPSQITDAHGIEGRQDVTDKMTAALNAITDTAGAP